MFSGSNLPMVLPETLPDETGSQKFKMAAEIMKLPVTQLIYTIAITVQRLCHVFFGQKTWRNVWEFCPMSECVVNQ